MKYSKFIKPNDYIEIIAPSFGVAYDPYLIRLTNGVNFFKSLGYKINYGENVFKLENAESNTPIKRAKEFETAYLNEKNSLIWAATGGEIECLILPKIDFDKIANSTPKWFMGYSDNTCIGFVLTTIYDIATIYGVHIGDFSLGLSHKCLKDALSLLEGKKNHFLSYHKHENPYDKNKPILGYKFTEKVIYSAIPNKNCILKGRLIGGCLDVLVNLCGTKYDQVKNFNDKYKNDGIIFFFDVYELNSLAFLRSLFQLKMAGWFKHVKGIIIGRINFENVIFDVTYKQALKKLNLNFPIIYDADIGHLPPTIPLINGAIYEIKFNNSRCEYKYFLK